MGETGNYFIICVGNTNTYNIHKRINFEFVIRYKYLLMQLNPLLTINISNQVESKLKSNLVGLCPDMVVRAVYELATYEYGQSISLLFKH